MADIVIKVENLNKKYRIGKNKGAYKTFREALVELPSLLFKKNTDEEMWALRDFSFEVKRGEVVGIIGRNGAGKTTLLKILSRITEPTAGRIRICGRVVSLLEVGTGFHPELTGRENIYLNGAILGMKKKEIRDKFDEIVAFSEVERFIDTPIKYYSSGMYVRLAFAVAAHLEPEILIVDEVLAVGDAAFQKKCLGKMGEIAKGGRTVLFVSHNMAAINRLCNKVVWLDEGQAKTIGYPKNVIAAYLSFGAEAIGECRWDNLEKAPGNGDIRFRAVRILNSENETAGVIDQSRPFYVEIEYEIFNPLASTQIGFWLLTSDGTLVFVAGDIEDTDWLNKTRLPGRYVSRCKVPGEILNAGAYILNVGFDCPVGNSAFMKDSVLNFRIEHTNVPLHSSHGGWKPSGMLCLSLEWHVSKRVIPK